MCHLNARLTPVYKRLMIAAIEEAAAEHLSKRLSIKYDALRCDLEQFCNYKFKKLFQLLRLSQKLDIIGCYLLKENEGYAQNVLRDWGEVTPTQDSNKKLIKDVEQLVFVTNCQSSSQAITLLYEWQTCR